jgi:thioredoxin 1
MESFQQLINGEQPVLVDFFATWCGPCKAMEPIVKEVAHSVQGTARVIKIDIDKTQETANAYAIQGVPTFMIFKKGKMLWRHSGMLDKHTLLNVVNQHK